MDERGEHGDGNEFVHADFAAPQIAQSSAENRQHQNNGTDGGADFADRCVQLVKPIGKVGVDDEGGADANPEEQPRRNFVVATGAGMFVSVTVGLHVTVWTVQRAAVVQD